MKILDAIKKLFKNYMIAGTAVIVPLIGTYLILKFIIVSIDELMISLLPLKFQPQAILGYSVPGIGLVATIIIIILAGVLMRLYIGKKLVKLGDYIISKIPLGRSIYSGFKQIMSAAFTDSKEKFSRVVAIEYPRKGIWSLGFITGDTFFSKSISTDKVLVNVFIPTTPTPMSGFLMMVPKEDIIEIPISADAAFKFIISGGIIQENDPDEILSRVKS